MELKPRDMDSILGPIIDEVGCLSPIIKEKIVVQITAQLNRLVNEQIINILVVQGQQLNEQINSRVKSTIQMASDALKNEVRQAISELKTDVATIKKSVGITEEKLDSVYSGTESVARLTAGLTRVISGIDQKISAEVTRGGLTRVSSLSKKQPREEEIKKVEKKVEKKKVETKTKKVTPKEKNKKTQPTLKKEEDTKKLTVSNDTILSDINKMVFKDIVKKAKDLGISIKPRMKKLEIIDAIEKLSKTT